MSPLLSDMYAFIPVGEWKRSKELVEHMLKIGLLPTVSTYNIAISGCTGAEQVVARA